MLWNKNPPLQLIWPKYTNYTDYVDLIQILPKANFLKPQHLMSMAYIVHCIYNFSYAKELQQGVFFRWVLQRLLLSSVAPTEQHWCHLLLAEHTHYGFCGAPSSSFIGSRIVMNTELSN